MNLHFEELTGSGGARIGIASLDAEKSLNALSLPMILGLGERLEAWAKDPNIVCVLLRGSGYAIGKTATGYVLVAAPASAPTAAAERTMPSITIVGQAEQGATTEGSGSYTARRITIGKGEQAMKEIPQSDRKSVV